MPAVQGQAPGFITFPSAQFEADPAGAVSVVDRSFGEIRRTDAQPYLYGTGQAMSRVTSYDQAIKRWLPVPREFVSPDGRRYVYTTTTGPPFVSKAHVVDAASGAERAYDLPGLPMVAVVVDFAADGVYMTAGWEGYPNGLWRFNPADASFGKLSDQHGVVTVSDGVLWTLYLKGPSHTYPGGYPVDTVRYVDLTRGTADDWFSPRVAIGAAGVDSRNRPLIAAYANATSQNQGDPDIWQLSGPGQAKRILTRWSGSGSLSDSHGLWLSSDRGLHLYTDASGLRKVAATTAVPVGPCV